MSAEPRPGDTFLLFNGRSTTVQIPSRQEYSQPTHNGLTVSAWVRRDVADFPHFEQNHYVHWMGKGEGVGATGKQEWVCRMYGEHTNRDDPRPDRIRALMKQNSLQMSQVLGSNCESGKKLPLPVRREGVPCCPLPFVIAPGGRVKLLGP